MHIQKEKKKTIDELADRKARKMESENQELVQKIREDERILREKTELANKLKLENEKADRAIRELARQSDFNQLELEKIKE